MIPLKWTRTFLTKWVLPFLALAALLGWHIRENMLGPRPEPLIAAFVSVCALVIFFFSLKRQYKEDPDAVLDGGAFIRVVFGKEIEDIPIANLRSVEAGKLFTHTKVALVLKDKGKFGEVIAFYPYQKKDDSGENAVVASLRSKVGARG